MEKSLRYRCILSYRYDDCFEINGEEVGKDE